MAGQGYSFFRTSGRKSARSVASHPASSREMTAVTADRKQKESEPFSLEKSSANLSPSKRHASSLSLIVPLLNEAAALPAFIKAVQALPGLDELIFADGGSTDATLSLLQEAWPEAAQIHLSANVWAFQPATSLRLPRVSILHCERGRASQMNSAAGLARGEILCFLHVDSRLPQEAAQRLRQAVHKGWLWGAFAIRFQPGSPLMWLNGLLSSARARLRRILFGDQALFFRRDFFEQIGGFPALPLMEDYALSLQLRQLSRSQTALRPRLLHPAVRTSARRYTGHPLRTMRQMHQLQRRFRRGDSIGAIAAAYRDIREDPETAGPRVFPKKPKE